MRLVDFLTHSADAHPERLAAVFPDGEVDYRDLDAISNQIAARLEALGVGPGERVAVLFPNQLAGFLYFWGVLKSGATHVDLPGLAQKETIDGILEEAKPKLLIAQSAQLEKLTADGPFAHAPEVRLDESDLDDIRSTESKERHAVDTKETDVALVIYTSGTTGRPKGVMLSNENLVSNLEASNELMGLTHEDSIMVVVPSYFVHGRMQILLHAMIGGRLVFASGFHFPRKVVAEIVESRVTGFSGVPYHFKSLMKAFAGAKLEHLKYVLITGGALTLDEQDHLREALPGVGIHLAYGQSEASPRITYASPEEVFSLRGTAGRPLPNVKVEILDDDDRPQGEGEIGEVCASGPNIMVGYVSGDEKSSGRIDAQGRLRTGDLGKLVGGHLYLVGRKSEMMKLAGERVFPPEIEEVINRHPAVNESVVFAVPDARLSERLIACVVLEAGQKLELPDLRSHCLEHMSFVRVPRELVVLDALPKTGSGKIHRAEARKLYAAR